MHTLLLVLTFLVPANEAPKLNQKVIQYVNTVIGQQVGRGECWDLAAAALDYAGAYLDRSSQKSIYIFGKKINPSKDQVYPGDILQIENLKIEYTEGNIIYTENMSHHTAIVYQIIAEDHFKIAHQNTNFSGRKVGISELNMKNIKKGNIIFYRPYSN